MKAVELNENEFKAMIKDASVALVDFGAEWCGPCQMQGPVIDELAEKRADIKVGKVDVEKESALAAAYQVSNIPTLLFFKNGELTKKIIGFHSLEEIEEIINTL